MFTAPHGAVCAAILTKQRLGVGQFVDELRHMPYEVRFGRLDVHTALAFFGHYLYRIDANGTSNFEAQDPFYRTGA